jgi:hypothetical protein
MFAVSWLLLLLLGRLPFGWAGARVILTGRIEGRLESEESGEGPYALVRAQERMRSREVGESDELFFIDVEDGNSGGRCWERENRSSIGKKKRG